MNTKTVSRIEAATSQHWVGNGFPVRTLISLDRDARETNPFILLDYAGPHAFAPSNSRRGVGEHPHRGFETVTIVYDGEVAHRDSTGRGGVIGPGDVQWMSAAAGILHQEFHSDAFTRRGGTLEMVQLWVNLPARDKAATPRYQAIGAATIPSVALPNDAGTLRVIAGEFDRAQGPASTYSPMNVFDARLNKGSTTHLRAPVGWTTLVVVLRGEVDIGGRTVRGAQVAHLTGEDDAFDVTAREDSLVLVLSAEPLHEPIAHYGPFVMNTRAELSEAVDDFNRGRFGRIAAATVD